MRRALLLVFALGCGPPAPSTAPRVLIDARVEPERVVERDPPRAPIGSPTVHPCEHALRCCHAYIDAVTATLPAPPSRDLHTACDAFRQLQERDGIDGCKSAMSAWRQSLQAMSRGVPGACGGP